MPLQAHPIRSNCAGLKLATPSVGEGPRGRNKASVDRHHFHSEENISERFALTNCRFLLPYPIQASWRMPQISERSSASPGEFSAPLPRRTCFPFIYESCRKGAVTLHRRCSLKKVSTEVLRSCEEFDSADRALLGAKSRPSLSSCSVERLARFIPARPFNLCSEKRYLRRVPSRSLAGISGGLLQSPVQSQSQENYDEKVTDRPGCIHCFRDARICPVVLRL